MDIARQVGIVDQVIDTEREHGIWREAMASPPEEWSAELKADFGRMLLVTDPDEWSDEVKALLLSLKPGSTIEEIGETVRQFKLWQESAPTDQDER
ncbi:MAG: hypothetical protein F4184_08865, partial [Gemmatimonadetes bacterium]|nr:hypothetical protein [Gemmatimonadota bacterium]